MYRGRQCIRGQHRFASSQPRSEDSINMGIWGMGILSSFLTLDSRLFDTYSAQATYFDYKQQNGYGYDDKHVCLSSTASSGKTVSASESSKATQPPTSVALTGEENEDVLSEIKGVRLYVKRGDKEFGSPGMLGTLRLLADREETSSERLLFRREPLWQASMNLRVNEGVRCAFDKEESVLRFTLKELIEGQKGDSEVVVYAFKPGKATSKQDFVSFGQRLVRDGKFMC
ncbi:hypothetical protein BDV98DRAFT_55702 [Pterulicium gracile]|uniref:RanBD1 domain-containing protein n=1 Tax=Pterulicium gracile TaxID=1884261 RepID=A0A5C3QLJ5_9AGAR|nr:hypothetical protein BDV98DRAFT_55702 [Pterula gracilis]